MVEYKLFYTQQAQKDAKKLSSSNLKKKAQQLLEILKKDPFGKPPKYEALVGDLKGSYSRRINIQHRIVYQVYEKEKVVKVIRMWTHYGEWKPNRVAGSGHPLSNILCRLIHWNSRTTWEPTRPVHSVSSFHILPHTTLRRTTRDAAQ